jgi:hypothetical protein
MDEQDIGASGLAECRTCDGPQPYSDLARLRMSRLILSDMPPPVHTSDLRQREDWGLCVHDSGADSEPGMRGTDLSFSAACPIGAE